jgi:hypothetical protein
VTALAIAEAVRLTLEGMSSTDVVIVVVLFLPVSEGNLSSQKETSPPGFLKLTR